MTHERLGIKAYMAGRYHQAVEHFEKALAFDQKNAEIYLMLATVYDDCLGGTIIEQRIAAKRKAIKYYNSFIEKTGDENKRERAEEWLDGCREDLVALDARVPVEDLAPEDAVEKDDAMAKLESSLDAIKEKYLERLDIIHKQQTSIEKLTNENDKLRLSAGNGEVKTRRVSVVAWLLLCLFGAVVLGLVFLQKRVPAGAGELVEIKSPPKEHIPSESIQGSYVWVESVKNRGLMSISGSEEGVIHVETRALTTNARSSGDGEYKENILEVQLTDDSGEGALMHFEFYEEGRNFLATWEDELGRGSAVGLRNEFEEIVKPDSGGEKANG